MKKLSSWLAILAATSLVLTVPAHAEETMKILVGFSPGGTTDTMARLIANGMSERLGKTVIVENRPGASGNIAAAAVAKSAPDGNTLLFAPSSHATNATLYSNQRFDTETDFSAIGMAVATPYVLVVNPSLPVDSVPELIAYVKKYPEKVAYASASPGTAQHLAAELFKKSTGTSILHVPYKGSAAALPDVMSGVTQMIFDNITMVLPHIKSGTLRPLAVTTTKRSALLPDLPTVAESGVEGFNVSGWFTLLGPAGLSDDTVARLNNALNETLQDPAVAEKIRKLGAETIPSSPDEAEAFISQEIAKWRDVITSANIKIQ